MLGHWPSLGPYLFFKCIKLYFFSYLLFIYIFYQLYSIVTQLHLHVYLLFSHITCSIISD